jgi:succinate dehydrogenase/fumarate reductase-like Fe-S protein
MSKPAFTPGPWRTGAPSYLVVTDDHVIADVDMSEQNLQLIPLQTVVANRNLIVSAPEMYEALKRMYAWNMAEPGSDPVAFSNDMVKARAAIAKAEGRS